MRHFIRGTFFLFLISFTSLAHARLIQIIHTNDLHSYFTGYSDGKGGYARVMTKIKELKAEALKNGIDVLQLDGGDWGEGTSFYLAGSGVDSVKALEMLGTEVATIGNHDHQLGGPTLGRILRQSKVKTKFVVSNLVHTPSMELGDMIQPYLDLNRAGISIRIIGLTTSEKFFQYSIFPGKILHPVTTGEEEGKKAKIAGKELVIALTHIGRDQDELLVRESTSIDVIVGGHSHTKISKIDWQTNKLGKKIPIVQAWAHGLAVGSLTLDVKENGGGVKVVDYKLHEVGAAEKDNEMIEFIERAKIRRNENLKYKANQLIGETETPMTGYLKGDPVHRQSCWAWHMATAARKAVGVPVGMHIAAFEGVYKPPGQVTYGDIADNFPHLRKFGDQGWEIATVFMSGIKLKTLMFIISRIPVGVTFSGLGYKNGDYDINDKATYRIAFPAEVALAINTSYPAFSGFLNGPKYSGKYYWPVVADYIKKNSPINCR